MTYEPKIVAFLCTWCSYTGADTAGIARLKSPANLRAIRVPCSGRVSPELVMRAFDQGADGVLILGCHIGECHYDTGNHRTAKRIPILRALMSFAGLEPERLRLDWVSASEGERFSRIASEFVEAVRALGPIRWKVKGKKIPVRAASETSPETRPVEGDAESERETTEALRVKAKALLSGGEVGCVIGYERSPRGRIRPLFAETAEEAERLVWNSECSGNLTVYLSGALKPPGKKAQPKPVAVVVKPCDSRAVNALTAEKQFERGQVYVIGVACGGVSDGKGNLQSRCVSCADRDPATYDVLLGEAPPRGQPVSQPPEPLERLSPAERMEYWLSQFDRCIRCYACRQACPMCNCPTCLYERDDSLWTGMGTGVNEKRAFHLGRAYHLAGRCVGCNECENVCPMNIPIGALNRLVAREVQAAFNFRAGMEAVPSPIVTALAGEYKEG